MGTTWRKRSNFCVGVYFFPSAKKTVKLYFSFTFICISTHFHMDTSWRRNCNFCAGVFSLSLIPSELTQRLCSGVHASAVSYVQQCVRQEEMAIKGGGRGWERFVCSVALWGRSDCLRTCCWLPRPGYLASVPRSAFPSRKPFFTFAPDTAFRSSPYRDHPFISGFCLSLLRSPLSDPPAWNLTPECEAWGSNFFSFPLSIAVYPRNKGRRKKRKEIENAHSANC